MRLFLALVLCATLTGCGSMGFKLGMSYNEYGVSFDFKGKTPTIEEPVIEEVE